VIIRKSVVAGAVGTDEADLLPLLDCHGGLNEEDLVAILLADVVETNHMRTGLEKVLAPLCQGAPAEPPLETSSKAGRGRNTHRFIE
jgi:hypothetical protein